MSALVTSQSLVTSRTYADLLIVHGAGDLRVDVPHYIVPHDGQRGAGISNGSVAVTALAVAIDRVRGRRVLLEALGVVDGRVVNFLACALNDILQEVSMPLS